MLWVVTAASKNIAPGKDEKYVDLGARYIFEPIAVETLGVLTHQLVTSSMILEGGSLKTRETSFLYQRISILVQRFNAVLLRGTLPAVTD